jgi:hypothetical protein
VSVTVGELRGYTVRATDGDAGEVQDLYFDDEDWTIRYVVASIGSWPFGRQGLIAPNALQSPHREQQVLPITLTRQQVKKSREAGLCKPVSHQQSEIVQCDEWPAYWPPAFPPGSSNLTMYPAIFWSSQEVAHRMKTEDASADNDSDDPHLRSTREVIGYHIQAKDGEIGHVEDFFVSETDWPIMYMMVDTRNWLPGRHVVVELELVEEVNCPESKVHLKLTRGGIEGIPAYRADDFH